MPLYVYALSESPPDVADIAGLAGEALRTLPTEHAIAVAGSIDRVPPLAGPTLVAQDAIVRVLHERVDALLPMRFGAMFADDDSLRHAVDALGERLRDRFARVRGRDQMTLRVFGAPGVEPGDPKASVPVSFPGEGGRAAGRGTTGAAYLAARAAAVTPPEIRPLLDALRALQRDTLVERGRDAHIATVYQLIDRGTSGVYRAEAAKAAARLAALRVRVSGPSPAYAFA